MGARRKRQYESGEASNFVSRKQAMRKLQLNLKVTLSQTMLVGWLAGWLEFGLSLIHI